MRMSMKDSISLTFVALLIFISQQPGRTGVVCSATSSMPASTNTITIYVPQYKLTSPPTPPPAPTRTDKQLEDEIASKLAQVHGHIEEWGTLNISQPLLMNDCGNFSLDSSSDPWMSAQGYVTRAQTETNGGIAQLAQQILATRLYGQIAPAASSTTTSASNAAGLPGATNAPDTSFPTNYLSLLGSTTNYTIPTSTALTVGTSNKIKELALRMMSAPDHRLLTSGLNVYVAIVQLSINPGKRTKQHYIADVNATFEYEYNRLGNTFFSRNA